MKITIQIDGKAVHCKLPFDQCEYVVATNHDCPLCKGLTALVDYNGKTLALAPPDRVKEAKRDFPETHKTELYQGPLHLRLPSITIGHDTYTGDGECTRCRQKVGQMTVKVNTLFGIEEDNAVLVRGRARVY